MLAIDSADTAFTAQFHTDMYSASFGRVSLSPAGYFDPSRAEREKGRQNTRLPFVLFKEGQGGMALQHTTMPLPANCDAATLALSPDGHTLAFWVRSQAGFEPQKELLQQWNLKRFGGQILRNYGGYSLWIGDVQTGNLRLVGKVQSDQNDTQVPLRDPRWSSDGSSLIFQTPQREYRSLRVGSVLYGLSEQTGKETARLPL